MNSDYLFPLVKSILFWKEHTSDSYILCVFCCLDAFLFISIWYWKTLRIHFLIIIRWISAFFDTHFSPILSSFLFFTPNLKCQHSKLLSQRFFYYHLFFSFSPAVASQFP